MVHSVQTNASEGCSEEQVRLYFESPTEQEQILAWFLT